MWATLRQAWFPAHEGFCKPSSGRLSHAPPSVAQGIEHRSPKAGVAGSNPAGGTAAFPQVRRHLAAPARPLGSDTGLGSATVPYPRTRLTRSRAARSDSIGERHQAGPAALGGGPLDDGTRAPRLRNRALHHEAGIGHVDEIPHPQTSELTESEAGETEHKGDIGIPTRQLPLGADDVEQHV